jgi:hypothetical protein
MRPFSRLSFMAVAALFVCLASSANEVKAQVPVGPGQVLISEFRLSGPGGNSDEFIEFYCNRDIDCDISDYVIQAFDPAVGDFTFALRSGTVIPARQYLLIADTSQYSLPVYATPDIDVHDPMIPDFFIDNEGFQLRTPVAEEPLLIDSVGFIGGGNEDTYIEGTGLQRATSARPADQYAYVRKRTLVTDGLPQDTNNNADDFVLVSVTGTQHPGITAPPVLGAPGPQGLNSPLSYSNAQVTGSLVEPAASKDNSPNRVRTGSGDSGTLSIRRSVTNNTSDTFDYIGFRVIEIPTLNSPNTLGNQAELRLVTSGDAETFMNSEGRTVVIRGTILEFDPNSDQIEPQQPNGGGLNSTVHANLGNGETIAPGETVDVQFLLNVEHAGLYRFFVYVEAFPTVVVCGAPGMVGCPSAARTPSKPRAARRPVVMRRLVKLKRGTIAPAVVPSKKSKRFVAYASNAGATPAATNATTQRSVNTPMFTRVIIRLPSNHANERATRKRAKKARNVARQKR